MSRHGNRVRTWALVCALGIGSLGLSAAPAAATTGCREQGNVTVGSGAGAFLTTIVNCSDGATTASIASLLGASDAHRLGLLAGKDRFIANNQFVAWIDTHNAPGILRGLWPVASSGAFTGNERPVTGGHQSLLSISDQFITGAQDTVGYMGLHVEIWTAPQASGGDYFTYRHGGTNAATYSTTSASTSADYGMQLFSRRTGGSTFVGSSGRASAVTYEAIYTMTPTVFHIETRLNADQAVATTGALGGLLLLTTQACGPGDGSCSSSIAGHSLHVLDSANATGVADPMQCTPGDGQIRVLGASGASASWDLYGTPFASRQDVDRYCVEQRQIMNRVDVNLQPATLRVDPNSVGLKVTPQYAFNDPGESQGHKEIFAYHYNATPKAIGTLVGDGVTGIGSLDVAYEPVDSANNSNTLAFGGNRGYKTFAVDITAP